MRAAVPASKVKMKCPVCGADNDADPTNCEQCKLQIGSLGALRAIRQNVLAEQRRLRKELSSECQLALNDNEFIGYMAQAETDSKIYVVTERRILTFKNVGWVNVKFVPDRSLDFSEIISFSEGRLFSGIFLGRLSYVMRTTDSDVEYWFNAPSVYMGDKELQEGPKWFFKFQEAYRAFMDGSFVIDALLMRANLERSPQLE
jgi:hypothetical protein